jgi:hypothetical protein
MEVHKNFHIGKYFYIVDSTPQKIIYNYDDKNDTIFRKIDKNDNDKEYENDDEYDDIRFNVIRLSNGDIQLTATNDDKTKEYTHNK